MFLFAAAVVVASSVELPRPATSATAHAQAIVRIVSGVRLRLGQPANEGSPRPRDTMIRMAGMPLQPARLIEFE
jgi:hypothetical protein